MSEVRAGLVDGTKHDLVSGGSACVQAQADVLACVCHASAYVPIVYDISHLTLTYSSYITRIGKHFPCANQKQTSIKMTSITAYVPSLVSIAMHSRVLSPITKRNALQAKPTRSLPHHDTHTHTHTHPRTHSMKESCRRLQN